MPMTPAQRKEAMPHGGQRRAAKRVRRSETYIAFVMNDQVIPKTPRGARKLEHAWRVLAEIMGKPVEEAFDVERARLGSSPLAA